MAVEVLTVSSQTVPSMVNSNVSNQESVVQAEAIAKYEPKQVPEPPKIDINRQPVISFKELEAKVAELNEAMTSCNQAILFSTDKATGKDVVRVTNKSSGELIRQMPSVEALKAMQNIDHMMGLIFNQKG